jgi:hypothetical protein
VSFRSAGSWPCGDAAATGVDDILVVDTRELLNSSCDQQIAAGNQPTQGAEGNPQPTSMEVIAKAQPDRKISTGTSPAKSATHMN